MAFIKKNIWLAFYFILLFWTVITVGAVHLSYQETYREFGQTQANLTSLTARAFDSSLTQFKTILDIVGADLTRFDIYADKNHTYKILESTVKLDSTILVVALYKPDGTPIIVAPHLGDKGHYNQINRPETRDTFQETVQSVEAVVGRTYYNEAVGELVIPFRKMIRDENGEPLFVLSISVSLKHGFHYFRTDSESYDAQEYDLYLYREQDRYFQIAPREKIYDAKAYRYQIRQSDVDLSVARLQRQTGLTYQEIKTAGNVVVNELVNSARQSISAVMYIDKYGLWVATEVKNSVVFANFIAKLPVIIGLYLVAVLVMFILFSSIATSEKRKQEELTYQAHHDYLTGIQNRFSLDRTLAQISHRSSYSMLSLNVDGFKVINDNFGSQTGDFVLRLIAERLNRYVGEEHKLYRSNGDEFVVVTEVTQEALLQAIAQGLRNTFNALFVYRELELELTCSVSIAINNSGEFDGEAMKRNVDLAMSHAKQSRSSIAFYHPVFLQDYLERSKIELALKGAIERNELSMVYQPQVSARRQLKGVEALLRWNHPELGFVPPNKFIAVAENCGYMPLLGDFILERSLADMSQLMKQTGVQIDVAINVSVKQLQDYDFVETVKQLLQKYQFDPKRLILEVTESVFAEDVDQLKSLLSAFKEQSIRISLDDFGTGYSSLSLLKHLPICEVKIDKSFVSDMLSNDKSYSMLAGVLDMAQRLGMETVAEGVESAEEAVVLRQLGCDVFQGYYFAKPMPLGALEEYIAHEQAI
ncbi:hypothetical protein TW81_02460 [Vibrio galatheae]|uniref:Diguanylate cyclase n=1 Tax=Vibrio galatheae TaxID=579748 RepID=A0A0F4NPV4_9VIBR|nr:EAL domain-containing protein [Vibrio galatheae]KJY84873.1 hypothetical protein TW81_02460 [Vibrio galatheae]